MSIETVEPYDYSGQPLDDYYREISGSDGVRNLELRELEADAIGLVLPASGEPTDNRENE